MTVHHRTIVLVAVILFLGDWGIVLFLGCSSSSKGFTAAFDEYVPLRYLLATFSKQVGQIICQSEEYLQSILSRKALLAVPAWEWLDSKVYPLMALEIMIPVETLRTLIAFERTIVRYGLLLIAVHLQMSSVAAVEGRHHASHAVNELHVAAWAVEIRHYGP